MKYSVFFKGNHVFDTELSEFFDLIYGAVKTILEEEHIIRDDIFIIEKAIVYPN